MTPPPVRRVASTAWRWGGETAGERTVPEETAIAFTYNRFAYAVMMATPADLDDFAVGFSLTQRVIRRPDEITERELVETDDGLEIRMWLADSRADAFIDGRRRLAGPTGCGLCGVESLTEAMRPPPSVRAAFTVSPDAILEAMAALPAAQTLNHQTRAVHAAGFWDPSLGVRAVREDVGRHNALDKLAGALARKGISAADGVVLLTSRVSVEMVQKAAITGSPILVAVSAPTALAIRTAEAAGITLCAIARDDGFEIFTHPDRILPRAAAHVA